MAQETLVSLIDDLDGSEADGTVRFMLDGVSYEIDLCAQNANRLRGGLVPFIAAARRTSGRPGMRSTAGSSGAGRVSQADVRRWANEHGYAVSDRGRIPTAVMDAYERRDEPVLEPARVDRKSEADELAYSSKVRDWAASNGLPIAARGRISTETIAAYRRAMRTRPGRRPMAAQRARA